MKSCTFSALFPPSKKIDQLDEHNTQEAPYKIWAERGLVTICEGTRVDYSAVTAWYCQMRDELKIDAFKIATTALSPVIGWTK